MIKTPIKLNQYLAAVSLLIVFVIDLITPTEFVVDILYLCCIPLVFKDSTRIIIGFSMVACLLIMVDVLFFEINLKLTLSHLVNRFFSIVAIVVTCCLAVLYRNLNLASISQERQYAKALEEMLFITWHKVRKPVANVLGLVELIINDHAAIPAYDLKGSYQHLLSSARELDKIIKELNAFIEQTEQHRSMTSTIQSKVLLLTDTHPPEYSKNGALKPAVNSLNLKF
jgi:hypothetical protein